MASIKDLKRMCKGYSDCDDCPLSMENCLPDSLPDNADEIIDKDKWAQEHPVKTYANECKMTSDDGYTDVSMKRCATEHRQLAAWLTELKELRDTVEELCEAKRLLKMAVSIINNSFPEVGSCWGCANHDEALALIGEDK